MNSGFHNNPIDHHDSIFSKIRGEDNILYTIQMVRMSQPRNSLLPNRSSISIGSKEKKSSVFRTSASKLHGSTDIQLQSLTKQTARNSFKLMNQQYHDEK
ncbi:unnamed protein product, partial [Rotaria magnacalcarata]